MPYIHQIDRDLLDPYINRLAEILNCGTDGAVNYTISRLIYLVYAGMGYTQLNAGLGVLESVKEEFYRRVVAPYEDEKRAENSDVYTN